VIRAWLDRLFEPQWAGGWTLARVLFGVAALLSHGPRVFHVDDAYASADMVFSQYPFHFNDHWILTPLTARLVWAVGVAGALMILWGGRLAKPGVLVWFVGSSILLLSEALNIKAYDRLMVWVAVGLLLGPIGERDLAQKARSPVGRWYLLVVYAALYGSTGWHKIVLEPRWWSGKVLAYHLVNLYFGGQPLGVWASDKAWITVPGSWLTLVFEAGFPLLVWFRRTNPLLLAMGAMMHLGILLLMNVGPFSYCALAAYPVLLHPEIARAIHARWTARRAVSGAPVSG
jgi:hypothetical protein